LDNERLDTVRTIAINTITAIISISVNPRARRRTCGRDR
jgi:hypothetical protein